LGIDLSESHKADTAYLLTGDKIDVVTVCDDYAYVRFVGSKRIATGWVEQDRVRPTGNPHSQTPITTPMLCQAAEDIVNRGKKFPPILQRRIDPDFAKKNHLDEFGHFANWSARLKIGARIVTAIDVNDGGSCSSTYQDIWSGDLSHEFSAQNRASEDPINQASLGADESLVEILGQPIVFGTAPDTDAFYLSTIDGDGNIHTACKGSLQPLPKKRVLTSHSASVCAAFVHNDEKIETLTEPSADESIALSSPRKGLRLLSWSNGGGKIGAGPSSLVYSDGVTYRLIQTGTADLDNSGRSRRIGIVAYEDSSSTGCGSDAHIEVPIFLDAEGHADPSISFNKIIFDQIAGPKYQQRTLLSGRTHADIVELVGTTYVELTSSYGHRSEQVWKISTAGGERMCSLQTMHYQVTPVSEKEEKAGK